MFFTGVIARDRPSRYGKKTSPFHRRARACPSPCLDRERNGVGWRAFSAQIERSRGTGPRATGQERGFPRHASVRDQAIPNYGLLLLILVILIIV